VLTCRRWLNLLCISFVGVVVAIVVLKIIVRSVVKKIVCDNGIIALELKAELVSVLIVECMYQHLSMKVTKQKNVMI
jgi:hypothetical protein